MSESGFSGAYNLKFQIYVMLLAEYDAFDLKPWKFEHIFRKLQDFEKFNLKIEKLWMDTTQIMTNIMKNSENLKMKLFWTPCMLAIPNESS